jgi:hypothetical protein
MRRNKNNRQKAKVGCNSPKQSLLVSLGLVIVLIRTTVSVRVIILNRTKIRTTGNSAKVKIKTTGKPYG